MNTRPEHDSPPIGPEPPERSCIQEDINLRPARAPQFEAENRALGELATTMVSAPRNALRHLAEWVLTLTGAQASGISLLEDDTVFRWHATAGAFSSRIGETLPRHFSPCGEVLDAQAPILMIDPSRRYPYIEPDVREILLVPFFHGDEAIGTVWAVAMDEGKQFDSEDTRLLTSLSRFAAAATQVVGNLYSMELANQRLKEEILEREQAENSLRRSEAQHRFLAELADATQALSDPDDIMRVTSRFLGEHLQVDRCAYAVMDEDEDHFQLLGDFVNGVPSIMGRYAMSDFGSRALTLLRANQAHVVRDVYREADLGENLDTYRQLDVQALICVPIRKNGTLVGLMGVHQKSPREWTDKEIELVRSVAGRSWESIERSRVSQRLRASDERLQLLIGHSIDFAIIISDIDNRVVEWMGGAEHITGWTESEILGQSVSVLFTSEDRAQGADQEELQLARMHGRAADKRWHQRKDGSLFFADGITVCLRSANGEVRGYGKVIRDATERKRAEERIEDLLALEQRRSTLLRQIAATSRSVNASLSIESISRLVTGDARQLIGAHLCSLSLTLGDDWSQAINSVSLSEKYAAYRDYFEQPKGFGIYANVCRSNQPMRLTQKEIEAHPDWKAFGHEQGRHPPLRGWLAVPLLSHGGNNLGVLQLSDKYEGEFTEEDEAVLTQLAAVAAVGIQNAQLYEILREQDRRKDEFLATLAHELRNPLAPIRTGLEVLRLSPMKETRQKARDMMERQLGHMVHLIDDLLDISRVSLGKVELKKERVDLHGLVADAIETCTPLIQAAQHEVSVQLPSETLELNADPTRITQVISNLLNNATKYTPKGGRIEIGAERRDGQVIVRVRDNGIGIPPNMLEKIFDIFAQAGRPHGQAQGGLGIGLSLVRRLVEMHGGQVKAESEGSGLGSTFTVVLPLAEPEPERMGDAARPADAGDADEDKLKVLVVDDNVDGAQSLAMLVQLHGHDCKAAYSGPGAVEAAKEYCPDLIFMDIGLPGMSGYEVAQKLRTDIGAAPVLIAVTGWGSEADKQRSREAGFDYHLTKPVDLQHVEKLLVHIAGREAKTFSEPSR